MRHILYKTTCKPTQEFYFGIHSSNDEDLWYVGSGKHIKQRIKQFGKSALVREVIAEFDTRHEAEIAETKIIQQHWKMSKCLNMRTSSKGWFKDRTPEERKAIGRKISEGMRRSQRVKEAVEKRKGIPVNSSWKMPDETKAKIAQTKRDHARARWLQALFKVDWHTIDISKFGWVGKVAAQSGLKPQKVNRIIQDVFPTIYENAFKRGMM